MTRLFASFLAIATATAVSAAGAQPEFREGWVRAAPPGATVLAAYGTIHNPGDRPIVVTGARSADFDHAALHEMSMAQGVMKMRDLPKLEVPPHGDVALEAGARHLMLFEPKRPLNSGDRVALELTVQDGPPITALLEVK